MIKKIILLTALISCGKEETNKTYYNNDTTNQTKESVLNCNRQAYNYSCTNYYDPQLIKILKPYDLFNEVCYQNYCTCLKRNGVNI